DPVDALREAEVEVLEIAIGDGFDVERAVGIVDPLALAQLAAALDDRADVRAFDARHAQRDRAVGEIDALADFDVARETRVRDAHVPRIARFLIRRQRERFAGLQPDRRRAVRERAGADFRAGQIL